MAPKLTNPLRPVARYRKGQAPANAGIASDSDSDAEEQQEEVKAESTEDEKPVVSRAARGESKAKMNVALKQVEVDSQGAVKVGGKDEVGRTQAEDEGSSEYGELMRSLWRLVEDTDTSSKFTETDSEDEKPPKPVFKPKMPKAESEEVRRPLRPRMLQLTSMCFAGIKRIRD